MIDTAIILAAGRGTRLKEVTRDRSKAMAPVAGKPMIQRVIDQLVLAGVSRYVVVAAPGDSELRSFFSNRAEVSIVEQVAPRGSGDALRACEGRVAGSFIVSACDSVVAAGDIRQMCELHLKLCPKATVGVLHVSAETPLAARSVVTLRGNLIKRLIEKPGPEERISDSTALPLYVLNSDIFAELGTIAVSARGEYELPSLLSKWCQGGQMIGGAEVSERYDLTTIDDLLALNIRFLAEQSPSVSVDPSARVAADVQLIGPVMIGPDCSIAAGSVIGPDVYLERGVSVAAGTKLRRVVALRGVALAGDICDVVRVGVSEDRGGV
jgi:NDP-sugar pyrophosphorylase family protein